MSVGAVHRQMNTGGLKKGTQAVLASYKDWKRRKHLDASPIAGNCKKLS